jgi:nucleoid-associated protein YgaU
MRRDIKIGMMIGVVLVIGAILIISILPGSSMNERMKNVSSIPTAQNPPETDSNRSAPTLSSDTPERTLRQTVNSSSPDLAEIQRKQRQIDMLFQRADHTTDTGLPQVQKSAQPDEPQRKPAKIHTVQSGETLSHISQKYYGTTSKWRLILEANQELLNNNPNLLHPGMKLTIPSSQ